MNTYLPPHLRRVHNSNIVGGSVIDIMENVPLPLLEMPKPQEQDIMNEVDRLLNDIEKFPSKDPYKDKTRKNVLQKKDQKIEAMVLGRVRAYDKKDLVNSSASNSGKYIQLEKALRRLMKIHNPNFRYTSIQLNKSVETAWHFDKGNVGMSYLIAFGKFTGGGVVVKVRNNKEMLINNDHKWLYFDGHNSEHKSAPSKGVRYAVIFFTKT
tara:strand:- start:161 stop:790 length:630 start_codon:yes stop_codon:yes gene_type:complete